MVNQANGSVTLHTKYHYDDMVINLIIKIPDLLNIDKNCSFSVETRGQSKEEVRLHGHTKHAFHGGGQSAGTQPHRKLPCARH